MVSFVNRFFFVNLMTGDTVSLDISTPHTITLILFITLFVYTISLIIKIKSKNRRLQQELEIREETQKLFKRSEEEKTLILNNINETILFIDNDHRILWANRSKHLPMDMNDESIIGKKCHKVFFNSDKICKHCTYPTLKPKYTEHYIPEKDIYLGWYITPVSDDNGKSKGFVKTIVDITEKKNTEKALLKAKEKAVESDKLKSAFLANMSHEIRTPMNAIIGFSELLNDSEISETERKDYISIIQSNGHQLLKLISDILTSSQLESGQLKTYKREVELIELLSGVLKQFSEEKKRLGKEHIEFIFDKKIEEDTLTISTDPERLKQVLYNLMTNALKFTTSGSITLGVAKEKTRIRISVADTGCGIHPNKLRNIFKRFSQADNTSSREFEGAGLGLTISKEFVSLLGGKLNVKSVLDKGSEFWMVLPIKTTKSK
jgi:PAS domain S-box-containing protein